MTLTELSKIPNKKVALVLSGGVVKAAAWHLGVSLALEDLGFKLKSNQETESEPLTSPLEISTYVGSSAGALVCLYLAAGKNPRDIVRTIVGDIRSKDFRSINYRDMFYFKPRSRLKQRNNAFNPLKEFPLHFRKILSPLTRFSGLFSTEGLKKYLLDYIVEEDSFESFKSDLFIVATQLDHSRKVIFSKYSYPNPTHDKTSVYYNGISVSDACAASMSVPPFYQPYPILNAVTNQIDYYIDGEIRDTLSTHVAEDNGCNIIISSWTHTPYHYHDEVGSLANYGLPIIAVQSIYLMIQKKIIASRARRATSRDIIDTVFDYMKSHSFADKDVRNIMSILESKLHFKKNVTLIDLYPDYEDYQFFFANSFSLNPKTNKYAVEKGYQKTMRILSEKDI